MAKYLDSNAWTFTLSKILAFPFNIYLHSKQPRHKILKNAPRMGTSNILIPYNQCFGFIFFAIHSPKNIHNFGHRAPIGSGSNRVIISGIGTIWSDNRMSGSVLWSFLFGVDETSVLERNMKWGSKIRATLQCLHYLKKKHSGRNPAWIRCHYQWTDRNTICLAQTKTTQSWNSWNVYQEILSPCDCLQAKCTAIGIAWLAFQLKYVWCNFVSGHHNRWKHFMDAENIPKLFCSEILVNWCCGNSNFQHNETCTALGLKGRTPRVKVHKLHILGVFIWRDKSRQQIKSFLSKVWKTLFRLSLRRPNIYYTI